MFNDARLREYFKDALHNTCPDMMKSIGEDEHGNSLEAEITTPDLEYRSGMELAYKCLRNDTLMLLSMM